MSPVLDAEPGGRFRGFEVGASYRIVVLEELDVARPGDVEQHAPAHHAVDHRHHGVRAGPVAADFRRGTPAVHLSPYEHVRERVHVGHAETVHVGPDVVAAASYPGMPLLSRASPAASMW